MHTHKHTHNCYLSQARAPSAHTGGATGEPCTTSVYGGGASAGTPPLSPDPLSSPAPASSTPSTPPTESGVSRAAPGMLRSAYDGGGGVCSPLSDVDGDSSLIVDELSARRVRVYVCVGVRLRLCRVGMIPTFQPQQARNAHSILPPCSLPPPHPPFTKKTESNKPATDLMEVMSLPKPRS